MAKKPKVMSATEIMHRLKEINGSIAHLKTPINTLIQVKRQNNPDLLRAIATPQISDVRLLIYNYSNIMTDIEIDFPTVWSRKINNVHEELFSQIRSLENCLTYITNKINDLEHVFYNVEKEFDYLWDVITAEIIDKNLASSEITSTSDAIPQYETRNIGDFYKKSHAIIIGISKYKEEEPLRNAYNDAIGIRNVLQNKYNFDNIITLFNEDATYINIREIFVETLPDEKVIGHKDRVLVYYSGHGKLVTRPRWKGEEFKIGYIIPYDARRQRYSTYFEMSTLVDGCRDCLAKHVLLILDCCYSGYAAMRGGQPKIPEKVTDPYLKGITANMARQVLAAGEEDQPVNDSGTRPGNSAFTGALLDLLEAGNDLNHDNVLTARQIADKLGREVARHTQGATQRPVFNNLSGGGMGDFVFKI